MLAPSHPSLSRITKFVVPPVLGLVAILAQAEETPVPEILPETAAAETSGVGTAPHAVCAAVTTCYPPYRPPYSIACQTYGAGCTWWVVPYQSVQCTGFDAWGRWMNVVFRCW